MALFMEDTQNDAPKVALSPDQVGERLGITGRHARDLITEGVIPGGYRVGDSVRLDPEDLDTFIARQKALGPRASNSRRTISRRKRVKLEKPEPEKD